MIAGISHPNLRVVVKLAPLGPVRHFKESCRDLRRVARLME